MKNKVNLNHIVGKLFNIIIHYLQMIELLLSDRKYT
jgi:hypothetical protein